MYRVHFDVQDSIRYRFPNELLDRAVYSLPDRHVIHYLNSNQVLIQSPSEVNFFPRIETAVFGYLNASKAGPIDVEKSAELLSTVGAVSHVRLHTPSESEIIELWIDQRMDCVPIRWSSPFATGSAEWARDINGMLHLRSANLKLLVVGMEWNYDVDQFAYGTMGQETIAFEPIAGSLVTDYLTDPEHRQQIYRIDAQGEREPVLVIGEFKALSPQETRSVAGYSAIAVFAVAGSVSLVRRSRVQREIRVTPPTQ
jgi:hypothetical protein